MTAVATRGAAAAAGPTTGGAAPGPGRARPRTIDEVLAEARARLSSLGALGTDGRPTPHGRAIARLPLEPRLAHMLIRAGEIGLVETAAEVAVLLGQIRLGEVGDAGHRAQTGSSAGCRRGSADAGVAAAAPGRCRMSRPISATEVAPT